MTLLTAFAAITACRFADVRRPALRQENSGPGMLLLQQQISNRARHDECAVNAAPRCRRFACVDPCGARGPCRLLRWSATTIAAERDQLAVRTAKLEHIVAEMRRAMFGRRSERIDDDQLALALEALEAPSSPRPRRKPRRLIRAEERADEGAPRQPQSQA